MYGPGVRAFEERLAGGTCPDELRHVVACLRAAAEEDDAREWVADAAERKSWWGITYKRGRRVYLRIDPKPTAGHVGVCVPGADDSALSVAGDLHRRKNDWSWVHVRDVASAQRLVDEIRHAYRRSG